MVTGVHSVPLWVTVTVLLETPVPVIVTVALRLAEPVLELDAVNVIVPSLLPATGLAVNQDTSSEILQLVFEVILKIPVLPFADPIITLDGLTARVKAVPFWVTVMVFVVLQPVIFTFPLLKPPELAETVIIKVPFPLPEVGETVIHVASSDTVHIELEATVTELLPAGDVKFRLVGNTEREHDGSWVTVTTLGVSPLAVIVMLAIR